MKEEIFFKEQLIHFIWQHGFFDIKQLKTIDGKDVIIHHKGMLNTDSGADFSNALVEIDGIKWAGNIELHLYTSDWEKHNHQNNKAYNNTILHVVYIHDKEIKTEDKQHIPIIELKNRIPNKYIETYKYLIENKENIACASQIKNVRSITKEQWLSSVLVERLVEKSMKVKDIYTHTQNNWEETFYILIATNFGFKINNETMIQLAQSLPLQIISKHKNSLLQLEALLLGQAGFLDNNYTDGYFKNLKREYIHLRNKFGLKSLPNHIWKMMRTRPSNFPTIRLTQLASLIHQSSYMFSKILAINHYKDAMMLLTCESSEYWNSHYQFDEETAIKSKKIGDQSKHNIITNTIVPMLFLYGKEKGMDDFCEKAIDLLYEIPAEKNNLIEEWSKHYLKPKNMADSQALIHLKNNYCNSHRCLECMIGKELVTGLKI